MGKPWPPPGRIACMVIGCRRTASKEWANGCKEIVCGKHWRTVPRALRRRHARIKRIANRAFTRADGPVLRRAMKLESRLWSEIVSKAIEIAVGITA